MLALEQLAAGSRVLCDALGWAHCDPATRPGNNRTKGPRRQGRAADDEADDVARVMRSMDYEARELALVADAAQLSTELFMYLRELARQAHARLGYEPPSERATPPSFERVASALAAASGAPRDCGVANF